MPLTEQQEIAAYSVDHNVLVSAGAGSGKTHVLVERYVEILRSNPKLTVESIVAVTFTRKAAGEMRSRLKRKFVELALSEPSCERWRECLSAIDTARIGTIHSLCESILRSFPAESSVDPQFEVLDEVLKARLIAESIETSIRMMTDGLTPLRELIDELGIVELRKWLESILQSGSLFFECARPMIGAKAEDILSFMNRVRSKLQARLLRDLNMDRYWQESQNVLMGLSYKDKLEDERVRVLEVCRAIEDFCRNFKNVEIVQSSLSAQHSQSNEETSFHSRVSDLWQQLQVFETLNLRIGGNSEPAKAIKAELKSLRESVRLILKSDNLTAIIESADLENFKKTEILLSLVENCQTNYNNAKNEHHKLDYDDLIKLVHRSLSRPGSRARQFFQDRVKAILVDEFQDTNRQQSELISLLCGEETFIFLIGDDKQSIYKFQGADVSNFNEWKEFMVGNQGNIDGFIRPSRMVTKLTKSFRSHPSIVDFVNVLFSRLLPTDIGFAPYRAGFEALIPHRQASRMPNPLEPALLDPESHAGTNSERNGSHAVEPVQLLGYSLDEGESTLRGYEAKEREARSVVSWLEQLVRYGAPLIDAQGNFERNVTYGDCAVLVPRNSDFTAIEAALARKGIPFIALAGRGFIERQEIIDMENLLRFLGNNRDDHALFGVLRSPLFTFSDDLIHDLIYQYRKYAVPERSSNLGLWQILCYASRQPEALEIVRNVTHRLSRLVEDAERLTLVALLQEIIESTAYDAILLGGGAGRQRSRNLWKLLTIAREHEEKSCGEFALYMSQMREFNIKHSDAPLESGDAVKLMTIHASKGLEYPVVALPALGSAPLPGQSKLIYHRNYGLALNTSRSKEELPSQWYRVAARLEKEMETAERKRLLYVAMTRARDYLGIFVPSRRPRKDSFVSWIMNEFSLDPESLPESAEVLETREGAHSARYLWRAIEIDGAVFSSSDSALGANELDSADDIGLAAETSLTKGSLMSELPGLGLVEPESMAEFQTTGYERITPGIDADKSIGIEASLVGQFFHLLLENLPIAGLTGESRVESELSDSLGNPVERTEGTTQTSSSIFFNLTVLESLALRLGSSVAHPARMKALLREGRELLDTFFASELFGLMVRSKRRWSEMDYWLFQEEQIRMKRPDLILEGVDGGYLVVDYKTDNIKTEEVANRAQLHLKQIRGYCEDLRKLTGASFDAAVYFARPGRLYRFKTDELLTR